MATFNLFPWGIVLHITGLALLSGGALGSFVTIRQLWKYLPDGQQQQAQAVFKMATVYNRFLGIGGALLLISGFMLLRVYQFSVTDQLWFELKMGLVLLIILNPIVLATPVTNKLKALFATTTGVTDMLQISAFRRRLNLFYTLQFSMLLLVFVLAVFKFQ